jgi:hypothetical protein
MNNKKEGGEDDKRYFVQNTRLLEDYRLRIMNMLARKENIVSNEKLKAVWESIASKIANTNINLIMSRI